MKSTVCTLAVAIALATPAVSRWVDNDGTTGKADVATVDDLARIFATEGAAQDVADRPAVAETQCVDERAAADTQCVDTRAAAALVAATQRRDDLADEVDVAQVTLNDALVAATASLHDAQDADERKRIESELAALEAELSRHETALAQLEAQRAANEVAGLRHADDLAVAAERSVAAERFATAKRHELENHNATLEATVAELEAAFNDVSAQRRTLVAELQDVRGKAAAKDELARLLDRLAQLEARLAELEAKRAAKSAVSDFTRATEANDPFTEYRARYERAVDASKEAQNKFYRDAKKTEDYYTDLLKAQDYIAVVETQKSGSDDEDHCCCCPKSNRSCNTNAKNNAQQGSVGIVTPGKMSEYVVWGNNTFKAPKFVAPDVSVKDFTINSQPGVWRTWVGENGDVKVFGTDGEWKEFTKGKWVEFPKTQWRTIDGTGNKWFGRDDDDDHDGHDGHDDDDDHDGKDAGGVSVYGIGGDSGGGFTYSIATDGEGHTRYRTLSPKDAKNFVYESGTTDGAGNFVLRSGATGRYTISTGDGEGGAGFIYAGESDDDGRIRIYGSDGEVKVKSGTHIEYVLDGDSNGFILETGGDEGAPIYGRVIDTEGRPVDGARVLIRSGGDDDSDGDDSPIVGIVAGDADALSLTFEGATDLSLGAVEFGDFAGVVSNDFGLATVQVGDVAGETWTVSETSDEWGLEGVLGGATSTNGDDILGEIRDLMESLRDEMSALREDVRSMRDRVQDYDEKERR